MERRESRKNWGGKMGKVVLQQAMNLLVIKQKCTWDQDKQE